MAILESLIDLDMLLEAERAFRQVMRASRVLCQGCLDQLMEDFSAPNY